MSKSKTIESQPLTPEEIEDVKKALKEKKGIVFKTPEEAIDDLHKSVYGKD